MAEIDGVVDVEGGVDDVAVCVFSPAPLLTITFENDVTESDELHLHPGGQGFWVARMLQVLGVRPILCAPLGGETGRVLRALLADSGIELRSVSTSNANGAYVHDRRSGERHSIFETAAPALGRHELDELYAVTLGAAVEAGVCVLAGAHDHPVLPADTYRRMTSDLRGNGVYIVADLCGELLDAALEGGLDLLKISHEELIADKRSASDSVADLVTGMESLRSGGALSVVVSRAEEPFLAIDVDQIVEVTPPSFEVVDHRGAGDSMTAALAVARARGLSFVDGLRLAASAGSLNVTRHGLASGHRDSIERLTDLVQVTRYEEQVRSNG